jgi:quinohemoprotein ethanol dehydrogenase
MKSRRLTAAVAVLAVAAMGLGGAARNTGPTRFGQIDDARMLNAANEPQNWLVHSGDLGARNYSALDQITPDNIKDLKPAWTLEFDTDRAQESKPIVVDGVAYVTTAWSKVYAIDAKTGRQIWFHDPKVPGETAAKGCCDIVNRGAAVYKGRVYSGTWDGRLIALDARTGKQVWSVQTVDPKSVLTVTSAPRVANGLVYIGNAGGDFGGRGYVTAYDAATGKQVWRFWLTPGDPNKKDGAVSDEIMASLVQPTWPGPHNEYRGGANVWNSMVYDPEYDQLLLATGDGFPWNRYFRSEGKGDNLFIASIVALDAKTGRYKWHYQETPGESWDYDAVADIVLSDLVIDGKTRKVAMHAPKAGLFWVLDRSNGRVISGKPFIDGVTWTTGLDPATGKPIMNEAAYYDNKRAVRVGPPGGAHGWQPMSFSPKTGLMYLQANQGPPGLWTPRPTYSWIKGVDNVGLFMFGQKAPDDIVATSPPEDKSVARGSWLLAWDPVKQQAAWRADSRGGGGALATGGGLVFQGESRNVMGVLNAYRADNGQKAWSYNVPHVIHTSPVSYMIDGEQYILVTMGAGGTFGLIGSVPDVRERRNGRIVAFKLNGKATLPGDPPVLGPMTPPAASETFAPADVLEGGELYATLCARCHGIGTRGSNVIPDLRRSTALANKQLWTAVVEKGALVSKGMINWSPFLPPGGADKIRAYVAEETRKQMKSPPPAAEPNARPMGL